MIPSVRDILRWWPFIARRYRRIQIVSETAVAGAVLRAQLIAAGDARAEVAAIFFAFAESRSAFPGAWRLMATVLAERQAMQHGHRLTATRDELSALCSDVLHGRVGPDDVRVRFESWLAPIA